MKKITIIMLGCAALLGQLVQAQESGVSILGSVTNGNIAVIGGKGTLRDSGVSVVQTITASTSTVPSSAAVKAITDAWLSPTGGITIAAADERYASKNVGAWLFSGSSKIYFSSFTNAYNAAIAGDTIELDAGLHDIGTNLFYFTNSVSVVGKGRKETTLKAGGFNIMITSTNCAFENLTFTQPTTASTLPVFQSQAEVTNNMNILIRNVDFVSTQTNPVSHVFEVSGRGYKLESVNTEGAVGHVFVLKGVADAIVNNCSSRGGSFDGLLIKGIGFAGGGNGPCSDIVVNDFVSEGGTNQTAAFQIVAGEDQVSSNIFINGFTHNGTNTLVGLGLLVDNDGGTITNVIIKNANIARAGYGAYIGNSVALTNTDIKIYAEISDSVLNSSAAGVGFVGGGAGLITLNNLTGFLPTNSYTALYYHPNGSWLEVKESNSRFVTSDGALINVESIFNPRRFLPKRPVTTKFSTQVSPSTGATSTFYRCTSVNTAATNVTIVIKGGTNYNVVITNVFEGDPCWISSTGTNAVYKIVGAGTVTTTDVPVVGSVIGDKYVTIYTDATAATNGGIRFGKSICALSGATNTYGVVGLRCDLRGCMAPSGESPYYYNEAVSVDGVRLENTGWTISISSFSNTLSSNIKITPKTFIINRTVYVGAFADGWTSSSASVQGTWNDLIADIELYNSGISVALKPITTLP